MSWPVLSEEHLKSVISAAEWDLFSATALATGAGNVIAQACASIAGRVRGYVSGRTPAVTLDTTPGSVPEELLDAASVLLMEAVATRLPGSGIMIDEARQKRIENAARELRDAQRGLIGITPAGGATEEAASAGEDEDTAGGQYGGETPMRWS